MRSGPFDNRMCPKINSISSKPWPQAKKKNKIMSSTIGAKYHSTQRMRLLMAVITERERERVPF
jgi:hypothetical protein